MTIKISHWYGRLGNNIQQCALGTMVAEAREDTFESIDHEIISKHKTSFGLSNTNYESKWFYYEGEHQEIATDIEYIYSNMRRVCKKYVAPHLKIPKISVPDDTLVIHIRSGDIFDQRVDNPTNYVPNPLCFYKELLELYPRSYIVTEPDNYNPIVEELKKDPRVTVQSKSVEEDFGLLLSAKNIASSGVGTFAISAALCSERVENFYCSDLMISEHLNYMMLISTDVRVHLMPLSNYLRPGDWKNTNEQREFIMNYENI